MNNHLKYKIGIIGLGVLGIAYLFDNIINEYSKIIFGFAAIWLFIYGISRLHSAFKSSSVTIANNSNIRSLYSAISVISILTFANPHVYLDTMILIGSISQQFADINRVYFLTGACSASFVWFFSLAYGARFLTPLMKKPSHWRILDSIIAIIMFIIAFNLASHGGWF